MNKSSNNIPELKGNDIFSPDSPFRISDSLADITDMMSDSSSEHHQIERYHLLMECYNAVSFEYNTDSDALGFDFWDENGRKRVFLARNFLKNVSGSKFFSPDSRIAVMDAMTAAINGQIRTEVDIQTDIFGGNMRWWHVQMMSLFDESDRVYSVIGLLQDAQSAHEMERIRSDLEATLRRKAETDELTGIYNKNTAQDKIRELLSKHKPDTSSALLILDIDNFKQINDTLGHYYGDSFLKEAAGIIKKLFCDDDIIGRFGGDEFVIFIRNGDRSFTENKTRQILREFNRMNVDGIDLVSCSIGAAIVGSDDATDYETAFMRADSALYESKRQGKNRFNIFNKDDSVFDMRKITYTAMDAAGRLSADRDSISSTVLNMLLSSDNVDEAVDSMLKATVNSLRFSRAFICERVKGDEFLVTGDYISPTVSGDHAELLGSPKHLEHYLNELPVRFDNSYDFYYCQNCSVDGVNSYIACSIHDNKMLYGFLVFEQTAADRILSQEQVENLCFVSRLMGLYLQKQRGSENISLYHVLDSGSFNNWAIPSVFVSPPDELTITIVNRAANALLKCAPGQPCRGHLCPDGRHGDCDNCILTAAANGQHGRTQLINGITASAEKTFFSGKNMLSVVFEHFTKCEQ